jgi:ABC-2 type transport system permease protein
MSAQPYVEAPRRWGTLAELAKLPAFLRRDLLTALSYRFGFVTGWIALGLQAVLFYFVGELVDPGALPSYGGHDVTYLEFAIIGIALGGFTALALGRISAGIRNEQLMGTLESLLVTPTSPNTIQIGTVLYDLVYVPVRTALFLVFATLVFGLDLRAAGLPAALLVLLVFIPFVWGLGVANAGLVLTFRRGSGVVAFGAMVLTLLSGAYFPLDLLPGWLAAVAEYNPLALTIDSMRESLLGNAGTTDALVAAAEILPFSLVSLLGGLWIFRLALRRERRLGTIGLY